METLASEVQNSAAGILVVDDTPANLQLLVKMLERSGYRVRAVPSGAMAIQAVQESKPELVLLDINMPGMNGYEVCEQLKADPMLKDIPVIFISALSDTIDKVKAFGAGGVDYVTKPFQFDEVYARVRTHVQLRQLQVERERQNRLLQENYDQLRKLEDLRDNLTHMIIHDMRSPLIGLTGLLKMLKRDAGNKLDRTELELLSDAMRSGSCLVDMVSSILDISRLEQGEMPINVAPSDMDVLVQDAIHSLGALRKPVLLLFQKRSPPIVLHCDASLITRVIANLLGNAIKFTSEGGQVAILVEGHGQGAVLRIADTGYGIPREYHQKIFEKFGQVDARRQGKMYSTGLGLTFCKLAIEAHGGSIGVESEVGRGSTFWFSLPGIARVDGIPSGVGLLPIAAKRPGA